MHILITIIKVSYLIKYIYLEINNLIIFTLKDPAFAPFALNGAPFYPVDSNALNSQRQAVMPPQIIGVQAAAPPPPPPSSHASPSLSVYTNQWMIYTPYINGGATGAGSNAATPNQIGYATTPNSQQQQSIVKGANNSSKSLTPVSSQANSNNSLTNNLTDNNNLNNINHTMSSSSSYSNLSPNVTVNPAPSHVSPATPAAFMSALINPMDQIVRIFFS
jgi:hypothetical protein